MASPWQPQQPVGPRRYRLDRTSILQCMMVNLDTDLYIKRPMLMKTTTAILLPYLPTTVSTIASSLSFPANATYFRAIMGHSQQQQQQQQQVRFTVGIRLTGPPQPPLKASGRLHQARPFQRYPGSGKAQNRVETQTKEQVRESWLRDYDQGHERLASTTTRPCMCSLAFSKAFEQKLKRLLAAVKPKASRTSSGGTVSGTHIVSSISTFQTASGLQGSHRHRIFY